MMRDSFQTSALMQKNVPFIASRTKLRMQARVCVLIHQICICICVYGYVALGFPWQIFSKNSFILFIKELYFP